MTDIRDRKVVAGWLFVMMLIVLAIIPGRDSFWIDEAITARLAMQPFHAFLDQMIQGTQSEHQMPLSMLLEWSWAHAVGHSEFLLRSMNLVWGFFSLWAVYLMARMLDRPWLISLFGLHPFFWFYTNEARPYALQICAGAWLCYSMVACALSAGRGCSWVVGFSIAGFVLAASSLLGIIPVACVFAAIAWILFSNRTLPVRRGRWILGILFFLLSGLGAFYVWTLLKGAGGTRIWNVSKFNLLFSIYELLGFAGLGPSRWQLREFGRGSRSGGFLQFLPLLSPLVVAYFLIAWSRIRTELGRTDRLIQWLALGVVLVAAGVLVILSSIANWPFWGRHLAALLPFVVLAIALCFEPGWPRSILRSGTILLTTVLLAVSSLELRFNPVHARDDYRSAAAVAKQALAAGGRVLWAAHVDGAWYYNVPYGRTRNGSQVITVMNPSSEQLKAIVSAGVPDVVVLSKPDIFDAQGVIEAYLMDSGYKLTEKFPAFRIYRTSNSTQKKSSGPETDGSHP